MTAESFEALATLLRLKDGPQREGARRVLVDGQSPAEAARELGISQSALGNTLRACRGGMELARAACGLLIVTPGSTDPSVPGAPASP